MLDSIFRILSRYGVVYLRGIGGTISLSLITVSLATLVGTLLAIIKLSGNRLLNSAVDLWLAIIRGTPVLLQIYFFWLWLPRLLPIELSDRNCVICALVANASADVCEIIRSGIQAVDSGQKEAALSLGISSYHCMTRIILPQALRNILPALGGEFISMIKQTSLASIFFIGELTTAYHTVQSATYLAIPSLVIAGILYFVLTGILTRVMTRVELRLNNAY